MKRRIGVTVGPAEAGVDLLDFLCGRFTYHCRETWTRHIAEGRVRIDGRAGSPSRILGRGDRVEYQPPETPEPPVETEFTVIHEDSRLLVVDKPANLPCHPGGRYFRHTLWALLRRERPGGEIALVHRIDRETSGLVLVARTKAAARALGEQMAGGSIRKRYLILVRGRFPDGDVDASGVLVPDPDSPVRKKRRFCPVKGASKPAGDSGGEFCRTLFRREGGSSGRSLVSARPLTGRRHQIRATLLGLGYPVVGDKLYGGDDGVFLRFIEDRMSPGDRRRLILPRQALHAAELRLFHPATREPLAFRAPLPLDMSGLIQQERWPTAEPGRGPTFGSRR